MLVTKLEPVGKQKVRVFLDEKFAFILYKGELSRYSITVGTELSESIERTIRTDVLLKRAKLRALHLLNDMGRTEQQLIDKLVQSEYPQDIIQMTMDYVKSFGYIDDLNYAVNYITGKSTRYSKKELYFKLIEKGISAEQIELAMEEAYQPEDSIETIRRLAKKKHYKEKKDDKNEQNKIYAYLMRKGFHYNEIKEALIEDE